MFILDNCEVYKLGAPEPVPYAKGVLSDTARIDRNAYMRGYKRLNKEATNAHNRNWKRNNKASCRDAHQQWRYSSYERMLWKYAKRSALARGLEFSIDVSDVVIPETCPVLGIPLTKPSTYRTRSPGRPSLDRRDNSLGYVKGNVFVISWRANRLKSDGAVDELERIISYMKAGW